MAQAARDLKRTLEGLPHYTDWTSRFNLPYVRNILGKLSPPIRDRAWKTFLRGPDPPRVTLEEKGLSSRNFPNPQDSARDLLSNPSRVMQLIKSFKEMVLVGGASRLLPKHHRPLRIFGHKILSMPGFIATSKGKDHYVCNLSKTPSFPKLFFPHLLKWFLVDCSVKKVRNIINKLKKA